MITTYKDFSIDPESEAPKRLFLALGCSLLVHFFIILLFSQVLSRTDANQKLAEMQKPVPVRFLVTPRDLPKLEKPPQPQPEIALPKEQIVSPNDSAEEAPLTETRLRSDRDSRAKEQKIKRGEDAGSPAPQLTKSENRNASSSRPRSGEFPQESQRNPPPNPPAHPLLRLNDEQVQYALHDKLHQNSPQKRQENAGTKLLLNENTQSEVPDSVRELKFEKAEPFQSLGARSVGKLGSSDFLPEIQDGDVTLLNAKADRYAVFVRRVAIQVFGALRKGSWQELSQREIHSIREFASIEAVMSKNGKLLKVELRESSGSSSFDSTVQSAAQQGTWDQHPPVDAVAADGNIHFIFKARTWSRVIRDGFSEQRWLLLGTGLL